MYTVKKQTNQIIVKECRTCSFLVTYLIKYIEMFIQDTCTLSMEFKWARIKEWEKKNFFWKSTLMNVLQLRWFLSFIFFFLFKFIFITFICFFLQLLCCFKFKSRLKEHKKKHTFKFSGSVIVIIASLF